VVGEDMVDVMVALSLFLPLWVLLPSSFLAIICQNLIYGMNGLGTLLLCKFDDVWQTTSYCLPMSSLSHVVDVFGVIANGF